MRVHLIVLCIFILFSTGVKTVNAQAEESPFYSFYNEVGDLLRNGKLNDAFSKLEEKKATSIESLNCNEKALLYCRYAGLYFYAGNDAKAITYWRDSALVYWKNCREVDLEKLGVTHHNLGKSNDFLDNNKAAEAHFKMALLEWEKVKDISPIWKAKKVLTIAEFFSNKLQDEYQAKIYLKQAEDLIKRYPDLEAEANLYRTKSFVNLAFGKLEQSKEFGNLALSHFQKETKANYKIIIQILLNLSGAHLKLNEIQPGFTLLLRAEKLIEQYNYRRLDATYNALKGIYLTKVGKFDEAQAHYTSCLEDETLKGDLQYRAILFENLADVYTAMSNFKIAHSYFDKALELQSITFKNNKGKQYLNPTKYLNTLNQKARAYIQEFNYSSKSQALDSSLVVFHQMEIVFEQERFSLSNEPSRYFLVDLIKSFYSNAVNTCLQLHRLSGDPKHLEEAYRYASINKGILLQEGSQAMRAMHRMLPDSILQKERKLLKRKNKLLNTISKSIGSDIRDSLYSEILATNELHEEFNKQIELGFPEYFELKYQPIQTSTLSSLQKELKPDQLMLDYYLSKDSLYCFVITDSERKLSVTTISKSDREAIDEFRVALEQNTAISVEFNQHIFDLLLADHREELNNTKHLIILPDETLYKIPFEAVKVQEKYLIENWAVSYLFSNHNFNKKQQSSKQKMYAGFGTTYSGSLNNTFTESMSMQDIALDQLPYASEEIRLSKYYWNGDSFLDKESTKENFLSNSDQYAILHLALHGLINDEFPDQSSILFDDRSEENVLRTNDLYTLQLNNQLAILSACNSGNGKLYNGDGVRSIARGFAFAGCPAVMASLWTAYEQPSTQIVSDFNKYLSQGENKAVALQKAKVDYLENAFPTMRSPQLWANLVVIGNADPIIGTGSRWKWWGLTIMGLIFMLWFFWYRR